MTADSTPARGTIALVTRPGEAGQRLTSALRDRGQGALWWPAFDLLAPAELEPLQTLLERLADFDLAVFVSAIHPNGAQAFDLADLPEVPASFRMPAVGGVEDHRSPSIPALLVQIWYEVFRSYASN